MPPAPTPAASPVRAELRCHAPHHTPPLPKWKGAPPTYPLDPYIHLSPCCHSVRRSSSHVLCLPHYSPPPWSYQTGSTTTDHWTLWSAHLCQTNARLGATTSRAPRIPSGPAQQVRWPTGGQLAEVGRATWQGCGNHTQETGQICVSGKALDCVGGGHQRWEGDSGEQGQ